MSDFHQITRHPETGEMQMAHWIDDHFGRHRYGVKFYDGKIFRASEIDAIETNGVSASATDSTVTVKHWDKSKEKRKQA